MNLVDLKAYDHAKNELEEIQANLLHNLHTVFSLFVYVYELNHQMNRTKDIIVAAVFELIFSLRSYLVLQIYQIRISYESSIINGAKNLII